MTKSSEKEKTTCSKRLESDRSQNYSRKVPAKVFFLLPEKLVFLLCKVDLQRDKMTKSSEKEKVRSF